MKHRVKKIINASNEDGWWLITLLVKKTLFWGSSNLEATHELQLNSMGPFGKPSRTMYLRYISLWCSFWTRTAPISPKSSGITKSDSYVTSPSFSAARWAYAPMGFFSKPVSSQKSLTKISVLNQWILQF